MNLTHLSQLRYIFLRRKSNLFLCMRFSTHVDPLKPVKINNPLKRRRRPPILNENESRIANRICVTIIGNGGIGQPRCVGLFTDLKSYFFNCGEGVGRFCREYDINMCAVKHIFVTQKKWENLSGIPDVHLTNQSFGVSQMSLHGPPGIEHFQTIVSSEKAYTELRIRDLSKSLFIDHTLQIQHVPVMSENKAFLSGISRSSNMNSGNSDVAYSYICKIFEKPGDFLVEKCVEYGVPLGPDLLKLKSGKNVILPSGETVYSKDVHTQPYPGTVILVVDCPSEAFLDAFLNNKIFETYQLPLNASLEVSTIFHFTPPHIFSCAKYQDWISRFHQDTQHFVLNSDNPTASSIAIHLSQKYFHMLHPHIFSNLKEVKESSSFSSSKAPTVLHPPPMLQLHIRPEKKLSWTNVVDRDKGNDEDGTEAAKGSPEFYDKLHQLKRVLLSRETIVNDPNEIYPEVIFLGTSSSTSSAYRNVSAILVNTSSNQSILLDCGEGAMMQLTRYCGSDVYAMLRQITCIFISHKHTDHYMGLFQLVSQRVEAFRILGVPYVPLLLVLPYEVEHMFRKFCEIFEDLTMAVRIFGCNYLGKKRENKLSQFLGNIELLTVPVKHCQDAHGIVLELASHWKIVYSGDSAPSQKLIDAGTDCTLLIHEASIEDGLVNEALAKKHSTPSQVIDISEKMNAKYTVTTHFSKRYLALPVFPDCSERHIAHAFDFMKVRMCDWPLLPLFTPIIKSLFQEQLDTHSERTSSVANFENIFLKVLKS